MIYEHPTSAASWESPDVDRLASTEGVMRTELDQCEFGLASQDELGEATAKKPTSLLTNSVEVHRTRGVKCCGGIGMFTSWLAERERQRIIRRSFAKLYARG